jgi:hypothetical protein
MGLGQPLKLAEGRTDPICRMQPDRATAHSGSGDEPLLALHLLGSIPSTLRLLKPQPRSARPNHVSDS